MSETPNQTPDFSAKTPPVFSMSIDEETDEITDASEQTAREFLKNNPSAKVLITKLAVAGNVANEFVNPCKREKYCESYEFSPGEELENLYSYVQENYEGGKYRFQLRAGNRNGKVWEKTLSDLPGTKPRAELRDDDDRQEHNLSFVPRETEAKQENPLKIAKQTMNEHLSFMKDLKEIFGDVIGAQPAAAPPAKTREQILIELASVATEPEIKKRIFDAIIGDEKEAPASKTFADVITDIISNPEVLQRPIQILAPAIMPYLAPYIGAMMQQTPGANGAQPLHLQPPALNPPASLQPPATATPQQTESATTGDTKKKTVSRTVTPARNPRRIPLTEIQETEQN